MCWPHVNPVPSGAVGKDCQRRLLSRPRFVRAVAPRIIIIRPVAAQSKVGLRPLARVTGSNSARGHGCLYLCLYVVLSCVGRGLCDGLITRPEESYRVSVCMWSRNPEKGGQRSVLDYVWPVNEWINEDHRHRLLLVYRRGNNAGHLSGRWSSDRQPMVPPEHGMYLHKRRVMVARPVGWWSLSGVGFRILWTSKI
jgi:hypothetical protein